MLPTPPKIIFVRGTTEAINLVAQSYGRTNVQGGDEVLITAMEHHSNIVPWQILCEEKGARLRVVPINDRGELLLDEYEKLLTPRTKMVAVTHVSNALGTINPVRQIIAAGARARHPGAGRWRSSRASPAKWTCRSWTVISMPSPATRCTDRRASAFCTARQQLLEAMPPYQGGGDMISSVTFEKTIYNSAALSSSRLAHPTSPASSAWAQLSST